MEEREMTLPVGAELPIQNGLKAVMGLNMPLNAGVRISEDRSGLRGLLPDGISMGCVDDSAAKFRQAAVFV